MIPAPFEVQTEDVDGVQVIAVRGELDLNTAPELEGPLDTALSGSRPAIVVNLSDCEFIDSTGVALLVRAWQRISENGSEADSRFVLCCPNAQVARLLEITGVQASIPLHDNLDDALAEARPQRADS
ncbi:MAG TPA: STAS domain-containing protein [Solirubrobacterales bacterium]|jgi:anti-sigma B factor antagonist|nr:STAS domain-containing protein [Solirubrobacterales bacterium]